MSEQLDQPSLRCSIAFDVPFGCRQRSVSGKLLDVAQGPAGFREDARRGRDEGAPP
jgi:hypothetical protein